MNKLTGYVVISFFSVCGIASLALGLLILVGLLSAAVDSAIDKKVEPLERRIEALEGELA